MRPVNWRHLYFDVDGRISRGAFWIGVATIILFQYLIQTPLIAAAGIDPERMPAPLWFRNLSLFLDTVCAWPLCAVLAKRQHDRGQSPHLSFLFVSLLIFYSIFESFGLTQDGYEFTAIGKILGLPLLGVLAIVIIELGFRKGTDGPNAFGRDPLRS
jgi:uncharacterized membrane protein YhaH (DUF805 family)